MGYLAASSMNARVAGERWALRRVMKRRENQLLARLARRFALSALERKTRVAA